MVCIPATKRVRSAIAFAARCFTGAITVAFASAIVSAQTFTITFDAGDPIGGLPVGTVLGNQYTASTGATFSANAFSGAGGPVGNWATNTDMTVVSSAGTDVGGLGIPPLVSGNLLRSFNGWLGENGDASIRMTLSPPAQSCSVTFGGIATPSSTRLQAFDAGNTLISSAVATAGSAGQQTLTVSGVGNVIASVAILPGDFNDWVGVDNITCTRVVVGPTKLAITAQPTPSVQALAPFNVSVQTQNAANAPTNVTAATTVSVAIQTGTGALTGTTSCNIAVGANSCTITGIASNAVQTGLVLRATAVPALTAADTAPFDVTAIPQTITGFAPASPVVFGAAPATLTATGGGSGNAVVFATTSAPSICTVAGNLVTFVGVGTCNLTANQAGGGNYSAAPQVTASIVIGLAPQTITGFAPASPVVFGAPPATLTATGGGSGNPVVFATTSAPSICTVAGSVVTFVGVGTCNLTANQAAGGNFAAAPQVTASIVINPAASVITGFNPPPVVNLGTGPITLTATGAPSGVPIVFATTSASSICTVSGNQVILVGQGNCILTANQAAGGGFAAAPQVTATMLIIAAAAQVPVLDLGALAALMALLVATGAWLRRKA
jgi:hypothetical protein